MTEIEKKALALVNEVRADRGCHPISENFTRKPAEIEALCRAIEQHEADKAAHAATVEGILNSHEAFRQKVSDAVEKWNGRWFGAGDSHSHFMTLFSRFVLPKPDPLVEALIKGGIVNLGAAEMAADIREALAKRGLKIVEDV